MTQIDSYFLRDLSDRDEASRYHAVPFGATRIPRGLRLWTTRDINMERDIHKLHPENERTR